MSRVAVVVSLWIAIASAAGAAEQTDPAASPTVPAARPRQALPVPAAVDVTGTKPNAAIQDSPKFVAEAKWLLAGYNNNEVVYTIVVTSQDTRIIRCITDIKGTYLDNGKKMSISDRQTTTVFPNQPTQVGNWMDLDQDSGATYTVKCHAA